MELNGSRHESDGKYIMIGLIILSISILVSMAMYVCVNRYEAFYKPPIVIDKFKKTATPCVIKDYPEDF